MGRSDSLSVGLLVTAVNPTKMADSIETAFEAMTQEGQKTCYMGLNSPTKGEI